MLVLALDTSTPAVSVAVVAIPDELDVKTAGFDKNVVTLTQGWRGWGDQEIATNRHGELLAPLLERVLDAEGDEPSDLAAIVVGLGPGPFTGLRVGIMTAKAMGDALGIPVYGVGSLDALGRRQYSRDGSCAVMTDARRKQVYWATFNAAGERVLGPDLGHPQDVAEQLRGTVTHVAGSGALLYRDVFADFTVIERDPYPRPIDMVHIAADRIAARAPSDDLMPLYLRRPDAQPPGTPKKVTPV